MNGRGGLSKRPTTNRLYLIPTGRQVAKTGSLCTTTEIRGEEVKVYCWKPHSDCPCNNSGIFAMLGYNVERCLPGVAFRFELNISFFFIFGTLFEGKKNLFWSITNSRISSHNCIRSAIRENTRTTSVRFFADVRSFVTVKLMSQRAADINRHRDDSCFN